MKRTRKVSYVIPPRILALATRPGTWRAISVPHHPYTVAEVTVDWDNVPQTEYFVSRTLGQSQLLFGQGYEWRASPSRTGVHLKVGGFFPLLSPHDGFELRDRMGDDRVRLVFDAYRYTRTLDLRYVRGYVFDSKLAEGVPERAGPWHHVHGRACLEQRYENGGFCGRGFD
jgi:hypothetical protein